MSTLYPALSLAGDVVLISGATSGIGEACAHRFAEAGCKLVVTGRRAERLDALKAALEAKYGVDVKCVTMDVTDLDRVAGLPAELLPLEVDILINNAGLALGVAGADSNSISDIQQMSVLFDPPPTPKMASFVVGGGFPAPTGIWWPPAKDPGQRPTHVTTQRPVLCNHGGVALTLQLGSASNSTPQHLQQTLHFQVRGHRPQRISMRLRLDPACPRLRRLQATGSPLAPSSVSLSVAASSACSSCSVSS